jgi:hypothetical protein
MSNVKISNNNTDTLQNKNSRYVAGGVTETANGMIEWWERTIYKRDESDTTYVVENFYANRLDLISAVFYGQTRYWWLLAQYNNILDPATEVEPGRVLFIPTPERVQLMMDSRKGGVPSTRIPVKLISPIIT